MTFKDTPLSQDPIADFISFPPFEDRDWGYARNKRSALLSSSAEWVQSIFSCSFEVNKKSFMAPNRDFPYEGLQIYQEGENWKMIDCIGLGVRRPGGGFYSIEPDLTKGVRLNPWRATYSYLVRAKNDVGQGIKVPLDVSYYLASKTTPDLISGAVELYFPDDRTSQGVEFTPVLQPFLDIRHMYHGSDIRNIDIREYSRGSYQQILLSKKNRRLIFYLPGNYAKLFSEPETIRWYYKLGFGAREEWSDEEQKRSITRFEGKTNQIYSFFDISVPREHGRFFRFFWSCSLDTAPKTYFFTDLEQIFRQSRISDQREFQQIAEKFPLAGAPMAKNAVWARIAGLYKFKSYHHAVNSDSFVQVPPAGSWWFRTPWFRDVFEGLLASFKTYVAFPAQQETIRNSILLALSGYDSDTGRIFNKILEHKDYGGTYNSADATLLCFMTAHRYIQETQDAAFAWKVYPYLLNTINRFSRSNPVNEYEPEVDGHPRVDPTTGLLLSVPRHSWTDTSAQSIKVDTGEFFNLPNRASRTFIFQLYEHLRRKELLTLILASPMFFLPEINAQWISMMKGTLVIIEFLLSTQPGENKRHELFMAKQEVDKQYHQAIEHYKSLFWNQEKGFLYNMVFQDREIFDPIETEAGVTAAAMLGKEIFSEQELRTVWDSARTTLLIDRMPSLFGNARLPFGLTTKNDGHEIFYSDNQYHGDVTWPRSTSYLIRLLLTLNEEDVARQILLSNLDHQMTEGAIFYNHELFSRPIGNNPYPDEKTAQNPVPVKNPIQFWSQWCDAYIQVFGNTGRNDE